VLEHLLVAERALGKPLREPIQVHHVDGVRDHNANHNLVICNDEPYHRLLHVRARAYRACGHADWRRCGHCGQWGSADQVIKTKISGNTHHPACYYRYMQVLKQAWRARRRAAGLKPT
jgi:hypothetical protein